MFDGRIAYLTLSMAAIAGAYVIDGHAEEFEGTVAGEVELLNAYIADQLEDLRRNFNPKIARLRKRAKVMVHPHAFDALCADTEDPD